MANKILLVEDDPDVREAYQAILERKGYDVQVAKDGHAGLALASSHKPDLILLDLLMPGMSGLEFLKIYQPKEKHPDVKVVVLSNIEEPFYAALELGAMDYLVKSDLSAKEFGDFIKQTLENGQ